MSRVLALLCALAMAATACGDSAETTTATAGVATTATPTTAASITVPTTTTAESDTTTTTQVTTTTTAEPEPMGEPYDTFVPTPAEGPIIGVVGVRYDDTLNVRSGPGITYDVVSTLGPTRDGISSTGEGWQLPSGSVWWKIEVDGVVGWANQRFLSRLGGVDDMTSSVVDQLGEIPTADTMDDLGDFVAALLVEADVSSADEAHRYLWTHDFVHEVSIAPTLGDVSEIIYDLTGFGDDSLGGYRLHIFAQPTDNGDRFSLMTVEATTLCQRGVSGDICT